MTSVAHAGLRADDHAALIESLEAFDSDICRGEATAIRYVEASVGGMNQHAEQILPAALAVVALKAAVATAVGEVARRAVARADGRPIGLQFGLIQAHIDHVERMSLEELVEMQTR